MILGTNFIKIETGKAYGNKAEKDFDILRKFESCNKECFWHEHQRHVYFEKRSSPITMVCKLQHT